MENLQNQITESLTSYWDSFLEVFPNFLVGLIFFVVFLLLALLLKRTVKIRLASRIEDDLLRNFIARTIFISVTLIGLMIFMERIGWVAAASGLLAGAGVSAIIIGLAFKDIGENFLAGFFLAFARPFSIGDTIEIQGISGKVEQLSFRNTHLRTFDGKDVYIPNGALIKDKLINYTRDGLLRHSFIIGLDYDSDIDRAIQDILQVVNSFKEVDHDPSRKPFVLIREFASSTVNLEIYFWTNRNIYDQSINILKTSIMNTVLVALSTKGYGMPADMVELKIYNEDQPIPIKLLSGEGSQLKR